MYGVIRNLLFRLSPEQAHSVALSGLDLAHRLRVLGAFTENRCAAGKGYGAGFP